MKKERDEFDMIFRSKLQNFEADTDPNDWEAIAERLDRKEKVVPLRRFHRYWIAAAIVVLLVLAGEIYHYTTQTTVPVPVAEQKSSGPKEEEKEKIVEDNRSYSDKLAEVEKVTTHKPSLKSGASLRSQPPVASSEGFIPVDKMTAERPEEGTGKAKEAEEGKMPDNREEKPVDAGTPVISTDENSQPLIADNSVIDIPSAKRKRWGIGMGTGSYSTGSNQSVNGFGLRSNSASLSNEKLELLNSPTFYRDAPKTDIKHKTPVSVGAAVSYSLTDRWALQSGLMFTLLSSEWKTNSTYHAELKQRLYYLGIPVGVSYKIAEWQRFQLYWTGGVMSEYLLTGTLKAKLFSRNELLGIERDKIHMKPWQFSINTRVGVSYPVFRFVSAFAEGGVVYYFDNGSSIETIRTEKPFNLNLQIGLRLGF